MMLRGANGVVYQAGLRVGERGKQAQRVPIGTSYRAVVVNNYTTEVGEDNERKLEVLCDVILLRTRTPLNRVPLAQRFGVNDAESQIPKPTSATLSGNPLQLGQFDRRGNKLPHHPTSPDDMNGDIVLVQFLEADSELPYIVGWLTHEQTKRKVIEGEGWNDSTADDQRGTPESEEKYLRFGGTEVRINKHGDVLVDTVGATTDLEGEAPSEGEEARGEVHVRLKSGQKLVCASGGGRIFEAYQNTETKIFHIDSVAHIGFNQAFQNFTPVDDDTSLYTLYVPYEFTDGVPTKAHAVTVDPTPGNESIGIVHGDGMAITMFDKKVVIKNADGTVYVEVGPAGVILNGQVVATGSMSIGDDGAGAAFPMLVDPTGAGTLATQLAAAGAALVSAGGDPTFSGALPTAAGLIVTAGNALNAAATGSAPSLFGKAK